MASVRQASSPKDQHRAGEGHSRSWLGQQHRRNEAGSSRPSRGLQDHCRYPSAPRPPEENVESQKNVLQYRRRGEGREGQFARVLFLEKNQFKPLNNIQDSMKCHTRKHGRIDHALFPLQAKLLKILEFFIQL